MACPPGQAVCDLYDELRQDLVKLMTLEKQVQQKEAQLAALKSGQDPSSGRLMGFVGHFEAASAALTSCVSCLSLDSVAAAGDASGVGVFGQPGAARVAGPAGERGAKGPSVKQDRGESMCVGLRFSRAGQARPGHSVGKRARADLGRVCVCLRAKLGLFLLSS
jgi:hypothetical protein